MFCLCPFWWKRWKFRTLIIITLRLVKNAYFVKSCLMALCLVQLHFTFWYFCLTHFTVDVIEYRITSYFFINCMIYWNLNMSVVFSSLDLINFYWEFLISNVNICFLMKKCNYPIFFLVAFCKHDFRRRKENKILRYANPAFFAMIDWLVNASKD